MRVIGLTGLAGSGKSTMARFMSLEHFYSVQPFAGTIKEMMLALGLTRAEVYGGLKDEPCDLLNGATPRHAMQTLGTEWGRNMVSDTIWVDAWSRRAAQAGTRVVVDDVRFDNEVEAIRNLNGIIIKVVGRDRGIDQNHVSEQLPRQYDVVLDNSGTPFETEVKLDAIISKYHAMPLPVEGEL